MIKKTKNRLPVIWFVSLSMALIGFEAPCFAQSTQPHKVLYVSNTIPATKMTIAAGSTIKYPTSITSSTTIYVQNNSKKIVAIKGAKTLTAKEMEKLFAYDKGISQGYFEYVIKKMTAHADDGQNSFGGVSRSNPELSPICPLPGEIVSLDSIRFSWHPKSNTSNYYFNLVDANGDVFLKIELHDTTIMLFPEYQGLVSEKDYGWFISERAFGSGTLNHFTIFKTEDAKVFKIEEKRLKLNVNSTEGLFELVGFYMQQKQYSKLSPYLIQLQQDEAYSALASDLKTWLTALAEGNSQ